MIVNQVCKKCAWIFEAQFPRKTKKENQLSSGLKGLSKEIFFAVIGSVLFEKRLSNGLECNWVPQAMVPHTNQSNREMTRLLFDVNIG